MDIQEALEMTCQTHPGMVRVHNEDSVECDVSCGLAVVADGMGGYTAGEVASGITISVMFSEVKQCISKMCPGNRGRNTEDVGMALLREKVHKANVAIFNAAQSQPQYTGMGTTVVSALFYDNRVAVAHVGDSRMYRLRDGIFETITHDHSLLQEQIDGGMISKEDARLSKNRNLVTRAVGIDAEVEVETHTYAVLLGDIYLLCSDGLNDMVEDEEIGSTLGMLQANLPLAAEQLIEMANDNGGRDNVSVILVKINGDFAAPCGWWAKLKSRF